MTEPVPHIATHHLALIAACLCVVGCGRGLDGGYSTTAAASSGSEASGSPGDFEELKAAHEREQRRLDALRAANAELQRAQVEERRRLDGLRAAADEAQRKAEAAREEAAFQECKATASEIRARVMSTVSECSRSGADYHRCRAARSSKMAGGTAAGCALAAVLGPVTLGASLAMCAAGAGLGYAAGGSCGDEPLCATETTLLASEVASRGLTELPMCGGSLGMLLATSERQVEGWLVFEVVPASAASDMGILPGDLVVRVGDRPTDGAHEIADAAQAIEPEQPLTVEVVRDGVRQRRAAKARPERLLGVKANPGTTNETVIVVQETPGDATLRRGDVVIGINGLHAPDFERLRGAIRLLRAGTKVQVEVERGAKRKVADVELIKRVSSSEL